MKRLRKTITHARLVDLLHYDPELGWFMWLRKRGRVAAGQVAGSIVEADGRIRIRVEKEEYKAHRLAYFYMTKEWPKDEIDHVFGDTDDNRWEFIRDTTRSENMQNQRKAHRDSVSGLLGASWHSRTGTWRAVIVVRDESGKKKVVSLGYHRSELAAHRKYLEAKKRLHPFQTIVPYET